MKVKILNFLITLTSLLVTLVFFYQKSLDIAMTQQAQESVTALKMQGFQELFNTGIKVSKQSVQARLVVSVKDFGSVGNGIADDTKAIQSAIDAVSNVGEGVVFFPRGTYKVSINSSTLHAITIRAKITLQGAGNKKSIIKLASRQGNYNSILAGERPDSTLDNFAMYDLAIDGNGINNSVRAESDFTQNTMRHSIRIYVGSGIHIERCRFTNQITKNTITANGSSVSGVSIKNNIFELIGGGNTDYDHSTIYTHGENIEIVKNYFSSRNGAGTNGARTAIEIHGDNYTVKDNVITGFTNGILVTGCARSSNNQEVTGNVINEVHAGIIIWSYIYDKKNTGFALSNSTIANNKISINTDGWRSFWGDSSSVGISLEPNSDAPFKNLNILNNEISFAFSKTNSISDNLASGIRLWRNAAPNVVSENIRILGNKIKNSLGSGIYISMPINTGEISQNSILNPGKSNGKFHDDYRAAILVNGVFEQVKLNNNTLVDNQTVNTLKAGIISSVKCTAKCQAKGNYLYVSSGANIQNFRSTSHIDNGFEVSP